MRRHRAVDLNGLEDLEWPLARVEATHVRGGKVADAAEALPLPPVLVRVVDHRQLEAGPEVRFILKGLFLLHSIKN